jgi:hypothetical protein
MRVLTPRGDPALDIEAGIEPPDQAGPEITDDDVPF